MISSKLHATILNNSTSTISNCVDDVLHALCSNGAVDGVHNINSATTQSKYFTKEKNYSAPEVKDGMTVATAKDSMTATREALSEMIYYYMERSFPPLAVPKVEDIHLVDDFSISDLIKEVIQQLKMNQFQPQYGFPEFSSIEDYLSKELVCKLEISGSNESCHDISLIGAFCSCYFLCHFIFCEGYVIYIHDIFCLFYTYCRSL
jgi:hypothetical protein